MLTNTQRETLKNKMLDEKCKLVAKLEQNQDFLGEILAERSDEIEQINTEYDETQKLELRNKDIVYNKRLTDALARISNEDFGLCEECSDEISFERLMARPTTNLCIMCKDEIEREQMQSFAGNIARELRA